MSNTRLFANAPAEMSFSHLAMLHTGINSAIKQAFRIAINCKLHLASNNNLVEFEPSTPYPLLSMENNTSSRSSICWKIRQALATNPAFRAIHRIKHHYREPRPAVTAHSNSPSSSHLSQRMKANTKGEGAIPINFDNSIPITSMVNGKASKVASPHLATSEVAFKVEPEPRRVQGSRVETRHLEQQGNKKTLDINDTFTEYIERARKNIIRSTSNVGNTSSLKRGH
ncbi:hypothetical protein Fmac_029885 [Flemingia macrophylla]|uniref:Uncharacterized protein n=1 Tax=Flemingia macrophylla TaxID=520843 RepID=A0ABD1LBR5_9FABA